MFPDTTGLDGVNRTALGEAVLGDPEKLRRLEALVHPAVAEERARFLAANAGAWLVVLDIPLLFETGGAGGVDKAVVVRSEERRDGQECVGECRSRWSPAP